jgi:hypothetical protein
MWCYKEYEAVYSRFFIEIIELFRLLFGPFLIGLDQQNEFLASFASIVVNRFFTLIPRGRHDRMVVGLTNTYAISAYHH